MTISKSNKYWILIIFILICTIIIGGLIIWSKYSPNQPIEIHLPTDKEWYGQIYIGGAVNNPGLYSFYESDDLKSLIQAAGGTTSNAKTREIKLYIPGENEKVKTQKIDINQAEAWLLEALPGIGETLALRIVDYRQQNGSFKNTLELLEVPGIGTSTYEQIKDHITVSDY